MSGNGVTIAVAVATCGRAASLQTCLAAIAAQTRIPDEIIVIDQQPMAETRETIAQSHLAVTYIEQPRLGLSASRNLALRSTSSHILAVTDDDCFPSADWVAEIAAAFEGAPEVAAVTGPVLPPPGDAPANMCALSSRLSRDTRLYDQRVIPWQVGSGANFAALTTVLRHFGGWNERLGVGTRGMAGEDVEILDRLLAAGHSILYDGDVLIHHAWQSRARRRETRWSYGYGIGALSGLRVGQGDPHGWRLLGSYCKMHVRGLARETARGEWTSVRERLTSLGALVPSMFYGVRAAGKIRECRP